MAIVRISTAAQNAGVAAIGALANTSGTVKLYTGTIPANANAAATGTLLATFNLSATAFGAASSGTISGASMPKTATAAASGTPGYARLADSGGTGIMDGDVTATGGGGTFTIDNTSIVSGGTVNLTSISLTQPAS